jgi:two-component system, OmpR family, sensor histidine kinase ChvG
MLDRSKPQDAGGFVESDEASEHDVSGDRFITPGTSWFHRLSPGSLTGRIALINLLGLAILTSGILYFNQFRQGLIDARVQSLMTQAQIIAAAVAGSATADTGNIYINPDTFQEPTNESAPDSDQLSGLDFPIDPVSASTILRRLIANSSVRARIIDQDGNLIVDSKFAYSGGDIIQSDLPLDGERREGWVAWTNHQFDRIFSSSYPPYLEYSPDNNRDHPEVAAALNGAMVSVVRQKADREIIILVSVPVQRFRAVLGSLILSTEGGEIDRVLRSERNVVFMTFGFSSLVTLLLSGLLAGTIATPIRKLSAAAERVRRGISKRVEIPDFTTRKDEIGHLSGSLRDMTGALYNRIDAIESFAADVSHELKNPLTSLRSAVETLEFVKREDHRQRLIEVVKHDVKRMDRLITDISDASRLDAELARAEILPVDIGKLLGTIVLMANEMASTDHPEVLLTVQPITSGRDPVRNYVVLGQDSRLGQVFRNLIDNARSFTAHGTKVVVRLRRIGDTAEIRVEDSGPGIRPENLERVFDRFYTDRPEDSFGKNSGLGLAISRQIVEAHKGRIWAENKQGKPNESGDRPILGARLVVRLPAVPQNWEPPAKSRNNP